MEYDREDENLWIGLETVSKYLLRLTHNFQYKLAALLAATLAWVIVQSQEILEFNNRLLVTIEPPPGFILQGPNVRSLDVTIRGPRLLTGDMLNKALETTIRLDYGSRGPIRIRVGKEHFGDWNERIKMTIHDPYLSLFVDEQSTRTLSIREILQGTPAEGYLIEKVTVTPNEVVVTGLRSQLQRTKEVNTEPIDINGIKVSKSVQANLIASDMDNATFEFDTVTVNLQVGESKINKRFGNVPVDTVGSDHLVAVRPKYVAIEIQGTPGVINFVKREDLRAFVDLTGVAPSRIEKDIQVKIPPETVLIETFPEKGRVEIFDRKREE